LLLFDRAVAGKSRGGAIFFTAKEAGSRFPGEHRRHIVRDGLWFAPDCASRRKR